MAGAAAELASKLDFAVTKQQALMEETAGELGAARGRAELADGKAAAAGAEDEELEPGERATTFATLEVGRYKLNPLDP